MLSGELLELSSQRITTMCWNWCAIKTTNPLHSASRVFFRHHEWNKANYNCFDAPHWIPSLWVKVGKRSTNLGIDSKPTTWGEHDDWWWLHGILRRKHKSSMEETAFVVTFLEPKNQKVPLEYVFGVGDCDEILYLFFLKDGLKLLLKSDYSTATSHF